MRRLIGKEYFRKSRPKQSNLHQSDINRCVAAVGKFQSNIRHPGLNFERLGIQSGQNHWSIRASQELRVILAVELDDNYRPVRFAPVNMGHHDQMYEWAERQDYYTDLDDRASVYDPPAQSDRRGIGRTSSLPPDEFEEWMLFLSDRQRSLVERTYHSGAARIRGPAGTGKTVIALHRAAVLGGRYPDDRILITTFSRSLCNYMKSLFDRMPNCCENIDFINIDRLASRFLKPSELSESVDSGDLNEAFEVAYRKTVPEEMRTRLDPEYLREEIRRVIKGRDASREEYLDTGRFERLGRIRSFKKRDREICWNLREAWDREMRAREMTSFEDRLLKARDRAWKAERPAYRCAVVDEGQDMTLVGVQFVRALVAGAPESQLLPDSILMMDDTAQRIYPGGYRPRWANLDYTGNSTTLEINYRNSRTIFEAARAVRGDVLIGKDANDDGVVGNVGFERDSGELPLLLKTRKGESKVILKEIRDLVNNKGFSLEEIAVLVWRSADVFELEKYLNNKGIRCVNLKNLRDEQIGEGVRIGTFDRAKGMEFRAVFIPRLGKSRFPLEESDVTDSESLSPVTEEKRQLNLDRLYAAMTRARDLLYLIADEDPCEGIDLDYDHFQRRRD